MMPARSEHYGELTLRRYFIGELRDEALTDHLKSCEVCRGNIEDLVAEEREFQAGIDFERFATGVEGKLVTPPKPSTTRQWIAPLVTVAAAAAIILAVGLPGSSEHAGAPAGYTGIKGGPAQVDLYVGGVAGQRTASSREPLAEGERIRITYRPGAWRYLAVVSLDEDGEVSPLYPEAGESLAVQAKPRQTRMLPDSVGFSGRGLERIIVTFSNEPLELVTLTAAARSAFTAAGGDVDRMGDLPLDTANEQFHRLVIKP